MTGREPGRSLRRGMGLFRVVIALCPPAETGLGSWGIILKYGVVYITVLFRAQPYQPSPRLTILPSNH